MFNYLKLELYKAFHNRFFIMAEGVLLGIVFLHVMRYIVPAAGDILGTEYPETSFLHWIGIESVSSLSLCYFMIVAGVAAFPIGMLFAGEQRRGYLTQIITRSGRNRCFYSKILAYRLLSGIVAMIPLILDFLVASAFLPSIRPIVSTFIYPLRGDGLLTNLFYSAPTFYVFVRILFVGMLVSNLSLLTIPALRIIPNDYAASVFPCAVFIGMHILASFIGGYEWSPLNIMYPANGNGISIWNFLIMDGALFLVGHLGVWKEVSRYEV